MNSKRLYFALIGGIVLMVIGLLAGAYGINSLLNSRADHLINLRAKNQALQQEQVSLAKAKQDVKTYAQLEKIAKAVVPQDKDQAEAVREIVRIAASNGVSLAAINFPASTLGSGIGSSSVGSGSGAISTTPIKTSTTAGKLSQLLPVKNIAGVYVLQITVQGNSNQPVTYDSFINFLSGLEHNRRTAQISSITLQPKNNDPNLLTFTLTLNEYIKP